MPFSHRISDVIVSKKPMKINILIQKGKTEMKKLQKISVLLLSVSLMLCALVTVIGAEETPVNFRDLSKDSTGKITLTANTEFVESVEVTENLTIDLNGYTLTVAEGAEFNVSASGVCLSFVGKGNINVTDCLASATASAGINIEGEAGIINIAHSNGSTDAQPIVKTLGASDSRSVNNFKNLNITSTASASSIFYIGAYSTANFAGVKIEAHNGQTIQNNDAACGILSLQNFSSEVTMNYCNFNASGLAGFDIEEAHDDKFTTSTDFIKVNDSKIIVKNNAFSGGTAKPTLVYKRTDQTGFIVSDIIFENSYIEFAQTIQANYQKNHAMIFRNSTLAVNQKVNIGRGLNMKFENGSVINFRPVGSAAGTCVDNIFWSPHSGGMDTALGIAEVDFMIGEGVRLDESAYNKIMNVSSYVQANQIAYEDGSVPVTHTKNDITANVSETYKIIYDPLGDANAPYIVVKYNDTSSSITSENIIFSNDHTPHIWNIDGDGLAEELSIDGREAWRFTTVGNLVSGAPAIVFYDKESGIKMKDNNVFVLDIDITADEGTNFAYGNLGFYTRSGGDSTKALAYIAEDGTVTASIPNPDIPSAKLTAGKWNHITIVVDTSTYTEDDTEYTRGRAFIYVNGQYIGYETEGWKLDDAGFYGIRYNIDSICIQNTIGNTIVMDNATTRIYGAVSESTPASNIANNGADYLYSNGLSWNKGDFIYSCSAVAELPVYDINAAMSAGLIPNLTTNKTTSTTITSDGCIIKNGFELNISDSSIPYELTDDVYIFAEAKITGIKANIAAYSEFGVNIYIPAEYEIISITADGISYLDKIEDISVDNVLYNKISISKKAYQAAEDIEITVTLKKDGYTYANKVFRINVVSYTKAVLDTYESTSIEAKLMYYILKYARDAINYYSNNAEVATSPKEEIEEILNTLSFNAYNYEDEVLGADDYNYTEEKEAKILAADIRARINLDSANLGYLFIIGNSEYYDKVTVVLNGQVYRAENGVIEIKGLKVYDLIDEMIINIDGIAHRYNLATAVNNYFNYDSSDEDASVLMEAGSLVNSFYQYAKCADEYKTSKAS